MGASEISVTEKMRPTVDGTLILRLGPLIALTLICVAFGVTTNRFATARNFSVIFQQVTVLGVLAISQTLIILTGGIDLSCGAIMALGGIVMTRLAVLSEIDAYAAITIGIVTCTVIGTINGYLVSYLKLPPFIVTLGMLNVCTAIGQLYSSGNTVTDLPSTMVALGNSLSLGNVLIMYGSVVMVILFAFFWHLLSNTVWGSNVYTVGDNSEAARLMGISVKHVLISVYCIAGLLYGVAALLSVARTGAGDPYAGLTENLDSITAVVLGGISLFGGRGSIWGTFVGILLIGVLSDGLILMGVNSTYQVMITGALVVVAVLVDKAARRTA